MNAYTPHLDWIKSQHGEMVELTDAWARINSGSTNLSGLAAMRTALAEKFASLGGEMEEIALPPRLVVNERGIPVEEALGKALVIRKRPQAKLQVLLAGHMDTVFGPQHPFQTTAMLEGGRLNGPGAADLKGGLAVMLKALQAFERSPWATQIGWELIFNPDEEIGSPGSTPLFAEAAARCGIGLVYEPALADGMLAGARKGSGNFVAVMHGRAAHVGRDFAAGRNAVTALAELIMALHKLNGKKPGVTVNPGKLEGGGPVNIVPDLAMCRFNIRVENDEEQRWVDAQLADIIREFQSREGYDFEMYGGFARPPKPIRPATEHLFNMIKDCGVLLGQPIGWKPTGGCCDGNNLAAFGLPTVDSLGVRGGNLHSEEEFVILESLVERAQLSALLLLRLASGDLKWESEKRI